MNIAQFNGMNIIESQLIQPQPTLKLSNKVILSDKFRQDFDAYLLDLFGKTERAVVISGNVFVSASMFRKLRQSTEVSALL